MEICTFSKARSAFYNAEPSCQETSALITLCSICSNISDNKSYKVTEIGPEGRSCTR